MVSNPIIIKLGFSKNDGEDVIDSFFYSGFVVNPATIIADSCFGLPSRERT